MIFKSVELGEGANKRSCKQLRLLREGDHARELNLPVSVLILTFSPVSRYSGT